MLPKSRKPTPEFSFGSFLRRVKSRLEHLAFGPPENIFRWQIDEKKTILQIDPASQGPTSCKFLLGTSFNVVFRRNSLAGKVQILSIAWAICSNLVFRISFGKKTLFVFSVQYSTPTFGEQLWKETSRRYPKDCRIA